MKIVRIGMDNYTTAEKIDIVAKPGSSPIQRIVGEASARGKFFDLCGGKKRRSIIVLSDGKVLASMKTPKTIIEEMEGR